MTRPARRAPFWGLLLLVLVELVAAIALSAYQTPSDSDAILYQRF